MPLPDPELVQTAAQSERGKGVSPIPALMVAIVVFLVGMAATLLVWREAEDSAAREVAARFETNSSLALAGIRRRVDEYQTLLVGMQGLFIASEEVSRSEFRRYAENVRSAQAMPGLSALHYTRYLAQADRERFVAAVRQDKSVDADGYPDFEIQPPGQRAEYYVIDYIEPLVENRRAFGLDTSTQAANWESISLTRDSGRFKLTPPFQLVQAAAGNFGVVMRAAVYRYGAPLNTTEQRRSAFVGMVGITLNTQQVFGDILSAGDLDGARVEIRDLGQFRAPGDPVAASPPGGFPLVLQQQIGGEGGAADLLTGLIQTRQFDVGERTWEISFSATQRWLEAHGGRSTPRLMLVTGTAISLLLAALFLALATTRNRALHLAHEITGSLRESESRFRVLVDHAPDAIMVYDVDTGLFVDVNKQAEKLFGCTRDELLTVGPEKFYPPEQFKERSGAELVRQMVERALAGDQVVIERVVRNAHGQIFQCEVRVVGLPSTDRRLVRGSYTDITYRKQAEQAFASAHLDLLALIDATPGISMLLDLDGVILTANQHAARRFGFEREAFIGHNIYSFFPGDLSAARKLKTAEAVASRRPLVFEDSRDGLRIRNTIVPVVGTDGEVHHMAVLAEDITERKRAEEKLQLAASVFTHAREGITITTPDGAIIDVNDTFCRITGYSRDEVLGKNPRILSSGRHDKELYASMWRDLIEKGNWYGEVWNRRKSGEVYAEMLTISAVRDERETVQHYVALFSDITPLKEHESQLEHIAHYDALTTLPNRVLLADRLQQAMVQAQRRVQRLAVAYLDLDGFKAINDNHGHDAGDQLLMTISSRMKQALREGDTLARLCGDEFVAVLLDVADIQDSEPMLSRLLLAAAQEVAVGELVLKVSASLGVTFYPQSEDVDADQLLRQADQAMYQAKLSGKNRYHLFDADRDRSVRGHHESLEHIRRALSGGEFVLHYQPKVNMRLGKVIGVEALIRWQHPESGLLLPAVFLPVIEDHSLSIELGEWVIDSALRQMEQWRAAGLDVPVSINVGARQLLRADFIDRLRAALAAHPQVRASDLQVEVLETSALEDLARASEVIEACREIGVEFSLDDFGTGYSSLTYLKRLPVALLKIDQSFVHDMLDDPDDLAILQGILGLSRAFHRQVIAEGVETPAHGTLLLQLGCELGQGYGIARPMPAEEIPGWIAAWRPDAAWSKLGPVSQEDLPLLFASVEHRAWVRSVEEYLKGERQVPPPLDHHQCHLGRWLDAEGRARFGGVPGFHDLAPLHRQIHVLVTELCEPSGQERAPDRATGLGQLLGLRDALLGQLKSLERETRSSA